MANRSTPLPAYDTRARGLGTSFGRGGATGFQQDLANSDCILIMGSNMAENHPVGFQWVAEAKKRGAKIIHVDPRFTRTSALRRHLRAAARGQRHRLPGRASCATSSRRIARSRSTSCATPTRRRSSPRTSATPRISTGSSRAGIPRRAPTTPSPGSTRTWRWRRRRGSASSGAPTGQAAHGAHGGALEQGEPPHHDETLQHPRCVYQLLRRHFARYTPELVEQTCGVSREQFLEVCEALCDNSGRERTSALCYAVGWTQHTVGVQYIRTASIIQLLLGNIGRPGGGILALRGHASIQGSTDIPTLYDILPGYLPMPAAEAHGSLQDYIEQSSPPAGYWANMGAYTVSLLKAWWGDAATAENDFCFGHLPRLTGDHSYYTSLGGDGRRDGQGPLRHGREPDRRRGQRRLQPRGPAQPRLARGARPGRDRDGGLLARRARDRDRRGRARRTSPPRSSSCPRRRHVEKKGTFTNTQRLLQWREQAVEPARRLPLGAVVHVPPRPPRAREARRLERRARPGRARADLGLPDRGRLRRPRRRGRPARDQRRRPDDGQGGARLPAAQGRRLDGVRLLDLRGLLRRRRQPGRAAQARLAAVVGGARVGLGVAHEPAHPLQPRLGRPRRQAVVGAQALPLVGRRARASGRARTCPTSRPTWRPTTSRPRAPRAPTRCAATSRSPCRPTARRGSTRPPASSTARCPRTTSRTSRRSATRSTPTQQSNPARQQIRRPENPYNPTHGEPGVDVFPYVATTYRLTEHHTAGGMSRWLPHLAELQPEMFCEVSPALARERGLEHGGWMTIVTLRAADRGARDGHRAHDAADRSGAPPAAPGRPALPLGLARHRRPGDSANDLLGLALDPNVHIGEYKAQTCDVRPGRRPRGPRRCASSSTDYRAAAPSREEERHDAERVGFFTDTSVCIGCKACEVACKEWNDVPEDGLDFTGHSYDNTGALGADTWRHVAFVEQDRDGAHALAHVLRRVQALHLGRVPGGVSRPARSSAPSSAPSSCSRTSATAAATASRPARTASSTGARRTGAPTSAPSATTASRTT